LFDEFAEKEIPGAVDSPAELTLRRLLEQAPGEE